MRNTWMRLMSVFLLAAMLIGMVACADTQPEELRTILWNLTFRSFRLLTDMHLFSSAMMTRISSVA